MAQAALRYKPLSLSIPNDRCDPLFEPNGQILDPLEWIAKVTLHIPEQGAHIPPGNEFIKETLVWYDRYLEPVRQ